MKRRLSGEIKVVGYFPVASCECLYILPFEFADKWQIKKGYDAIALCWRGKLHFRKFYFRNSEYCFKFFNRVIYLSEIERTEGTHSYINI